MTSRIPTDMVADRTSKAKLSDTLGSMQTSINTNTSSLADIALDVKSPKYGAKGDGITDDTTAIQNAINSLTNGGTIIFPSGTYVVSAVLNIPSNIALDFKKGSIVKIADNCTGYYGLFNIQNVQNISIKGLTFDGNINRSNYDINGVHTPEIVIYLVNSTNVHIEDCVFNSCGKWTIAAFNSGVESIYIRNNQINYTLGKNSGTPNPSTGIPMDTTQIYMNAHNFWIENNIVTTTQNICETAIEAHRRNGYVSGNHITGFINGILVVPADQTETTTTSKMRVTGNKISDITNGIYLWQTNIMDLDDVLIYSNQIECNPARFQNCSASYGICNLKVSSSGNNGGYIISNIQIVNNTIRFKSFTSTFTDANNVLNFAGIYLLSHVSIKNIHITGNMFVDIPATGIVLGNWSDATYQNYSYNILMEKNIFINIGINTNITATGGNPRTPIRLVGSTQNPVSKTTFVNNTIIDNATTGTYFTALNSLSSYDVASVMIRSNNILATGYDLKDRIIPWSPNLTWDSQVGAPTFSIEGSYIVKDGYIKIMSDITINDLGTMTQGFGSHIVNLPYPPQETREILIIITNTTFTTGVQWYLKLAKGSTTALIAGTQASDGSTVSLTKSGIKATTKLSFACDYLI